ncbi:T6SS immunity protein Tdi1 domain-containing protein [Pseudoclavibacter sp. CFCC 13611]|uniref:T6SS immunity protein Tdi1 domain-containing protein n=1 Tax=Pseudoclavibacter sp. CFCC 13611 TaxID=2615178 RepID=UPI001788908B|nr:T6SS immunity protein Tdi1 domain-containing protein [Pseudoclavibacter sp. CFCC 13611]
MDDRYVLPGFVSSGGVVSKRARRRFRKVLPPGVLAWWGEYGQGVAFDGFLRLIDPLDGWMELVAQTAQTLGEVVPVATTAMGDVLAWQLENDGRGHLLLIDYRHGEIRTLASRDVDYFAKDLRDEPDSMQQAEELGWSPFPEAVERLGVPGFDECFGYVPILAAGGPEDVSHLQRLDMRTHLLIIAEFAGPAKW